MKDELIYDRSVADGRFQLEILALRWALVALYALMVGAGVVDASRPWFIAGESLMVLYHAYYTWTVWHELRHGPLPDAAQYATPFLDTVAISLALIAVGNGLHPIWGVYLSVIVGIGFFYYPIARAYVFWLTANYACVAMGLQLRGFDVPASEMGVAMIIMLAAMYNVTAYTGGERRLRQRLDRVARTDPLTNLPNRRGLEEALARYQDTTSDRGLAVLMIDIDRFKRYNDQFGHLSADGILEQLGEVLSASIRDPDIVARYGGDEFVVITSDVTPADAQLLADRLHNQVARMGLCTVSVGVSWAAHGDVSVNVLIERADAALRVAKQSGRDRVHADASLSAA